MEALQCGKEGRDCRCKLFRRKHDWVISRSARASVNLEPLEEHDEERIRKKLNLMLSGAFLTLQQLARAPFHLFAHVTAKIFRSKQCARRIIFTVKKLWAWKTINIISSEILSWHLCESWTDVSEFSHNCGSHLFHIYKKWLTSTNTPDESRIKTKIMWRFF